MSQNSSQQKTALPLLPLRTGVLFPGMAATLPVGRDRSVRLVESLSKGDEIALGVLRDLDVDTPVISDLHRVGTRARVHRIGRDTDGTFKIVVEGLRRLELLSIQASEPFFVTATGEVEEPTADATEAAALASVLLDKLRELPISMTPRIRRIIEALDPMKEPGAVADMVTAALGASTSREAEILLTLDTQERLRAAHRLLSEAAAVAEVKGKIEREVGQQLRDSQREAVLRKQLEAIQKELGDGEHDDLDALRKTLGEIELPEEARKVVDRELGRLANMAPEQAEHNVLRRYLELTAELPWDRRAEISDDIDAVAKKLDEDHHGLDEVKKRILEHIAVRKLAKGERGAILCLHGPPGVGKTSLGQSIADATGRPLARVSLGGVRDEADVRGHRRTYVGALPGRVIAALRKAGAKNPVVLLDEIDKLGRGWLGSPEAALLEVLDPEQNDSFTDHYLDLPFDLSEVFFICTANTVDGLSPPLRDRLEVIDLEGYTQDEKVKIAFDHLLPKELERHGLDPDDLVIDEAALRAVIGDHTREAGVRQLGRQLGKICRAVTLEIARAGDGVLKKTEVGVHDLYGYLGKVKFFNDVAERTAAVGVATGLAYTPAGGDILFIESSRMPGKGKIEITGQLGDVMKESARAALTYVRSHADRLEIDPDFLASQDLHVHVPAGAVPKDGPSAGVTIFTALTSLLTGRRVRPDTAMTGECTLRGRVLPVGGIKAKVLAAHRAGVERVILPKKNERDVDEIPDRVRDAIEIIFAEDMGEVLAAALEDESELGVLPAAGRISGGTGARAAEPH